MFCSKCGAAVPSAREVSTSQPNAPKRADHSDQITTPKKKQFYLDIIPGAAAAQLFKNFSLTVFHGSPAATAFVVGVSAALGFVVGFALCHYVRTKVTKNRVSGVFLSLSISIGLSLPFFMATAFVTNSISQSQYQNQVAQDWDSVGTPVTPPVKQNTDADPNFSKQALPPLDLTKEFIPPASRGTALQQTRALADHGDAVAQFKLGVMYQNGQEVPWDHAQAMMWYLIAKVGGITLANQNLQKLEARSTPAEIDEAQRMAREWLAAHYPAN